MVPWSCILGPITRVADGVSSDGYIADTVILGWSERRLYAVHWRLPAVNGALWPERVCCPAPGISGVEQLADWLADRHVLTDQQLDHALNLAAPFLHALAPTDATASVLLAYSDQRVRLETRLNLAGAPTASPPRKRTAKRNRP